MSITDIIIELLREGKQVELPGIGTFGSEMQPPHHDAEREIYYPTSRALTFTTATTGDETMVTALAERECVGENVARQMWKNYIDALNDKMERTGSHAFGELGELTLLADGTYAFNATEGAVLSTGDEQPLEEVKIYHNEPADDPFARFESEKARLEELRRKQEAAAAQAAARAEEEARQAAIKAEEERRQAEQRAEEEARQAAIKAEEERREAEQRAAALAAAAVKEKEIATPVQEASVEEPLKEVLEAIDALPDPPQEEKKEEGKKKKSRLWIWLLLLLLLLLAGGGAYYYFKVYRAAHTAATTEPRSAHLQGISRFNDFTFNTDLLHYGTQEMDANRDRVCRTMNDYIYSFLAYRHYTNAQVPMMQRVREYAGQRLGELMADRFAVQRFIPYNDYIYSASEPQLRKSFAQRARCTVQGELLDMRLLDDMLQKIIADLGLQPDAAPAPQVAATPARPIEAAPAEPRPSNVKVEQNSRDGFDIIAGFYIDRSKAERMASRLHELGSDAYIIQKNDMYYVSMGSAKNRTAAEALFKHIKSWYEGDIAIKQL